MFYPYNTKTNIVYDLTRSPSRAYPFELQYENPNTQEIYMQLDKKSDFILVMNNDQCMIVEPIITLAPKEIVEIIRFSEANLSDLTAYHYGYKVGFTDATVSSSRVTLSVETCHTHSFLVGYEFGVYMAMWFKKKKKNVKIPPKIDYFLTKRFQKRFLKLLE